MGVEGFELLGLRGNEGVEAAQARGDALLLIGFGHEVTRSLFDLKLFFGGLHRML